MVISDWLFFDSYQINPQGFSTLAEPRLALEKDKLARAKESRF